MANGPPWVVIGIALLCYFDVPIAHAHFYNQPSHFEHHGYYGGHGSHEHHGGHGSHEHHGGHGSHERHGGHVHHEHHKYHESFVSSVPVVGSGSISQTGSHDARQFTVSADFLSVLNFARAGGVNVIPKIKINLDGTYTIVVKTSSETKELKRISEKEVTLFTKLFENPSLNIQTVSQTGSVVVISVSEGSTETTSIQVSAEVLTLFKNLQNNPNLQIVGVSSTNDVYTLTVSDGQQTKTISGIPSQAAKIILHKAQNPHANVQITASGKVSLPSFGGTTSPPTQHTFTVGNLFLRVYNLLKSHPTSQIHVQQETDQTFTLTITIDGEKKTYREVKPNLLQLLITLYKNPSLDFKASPRSDGKYTIVLPENTDPTPQTAQVPKDFVIKLREILDKPNIKVKIQELSPGNFELIINDGTGDKKYKLPESAISVVEKILKEPRQHEPNYHVISNPDKNSPNDVISHRPVKEPVTEPVTAEFVNFIKKLKEHPDLPSKITYKIQPVDDDRYDITVTEDGKPHHFKDLPHDLVQFFINLVNNPKTPHHVTERKDKPQRPSTDPIKPGTGAGKPTTLPATLTFDQPKDDGDNDDDDVSIPIQKPSKHEPSKTTFEYPRTKPKHDTPADHEPYAPTGEHPRPQTKDIPKTHLTKDLPKPQTKDIPKHHLTKDLPRPQRPEEPADDDFNHPQTKDIPRVEDPPRVYKPKDKNPTTLDLLNNVKNAPDLTISVKPKGPDHYEITVDDGVHKTTYPDVPKSLLTTLIKIRNNKHLPFEILPSQKPGHVNVKVPDDKSPDNIRTPVSPKILDVTDDLKNQPKTELEIVPDKKDQFSVTIKNGPHKTTIPDVPSDLVEILVRLRTDDDLPFRLAPGKDGKVDLIVPKRHPEPVKVEFTPQIIELIQNLRKHPHQTVNVEPGKKPGDFTLVTKDGPKTHKYPDLPSDLIPILIRIYTQPDLDFEVKPTKEGSIEFVPSHPTPDSDHFKVPTEVYEIISIIRTNPTTKLNIKPDKKHNGFTIILTDDDEQRTYDDITPDQLRLIIDLQTHDLPFSVKPTKDGEIVIETPKIEHNKQKVPVKPETKDIINTLRKNPHVELNIEPQTDGDYTIVIDGKKYPNISPSILLLITTLTTKPNLEYPVEPEDDGKLSVVVPKETPTTTEVKIPSSQIDFINDLRKKPTSQITVDKNNKGNLNIDFDLPDGTKKVQNVNPDLGKFLIDLVTNPKLPVHIYPEDDEYKLVVSKRPKEPTFTDVPQDLINFVIKNAKNPHLKEKITPKKGKPGQFDIEFLDGDKPLKKFPDANGQSLDFTTTVVTHPNIQIDSKPDTDGQPTTTVQKPDAPTTDVTIDPTIINLIKLISSPNIKSVNLQPETNNKFSLIIDDGSGKRKKYSGLPGELVNIIGIILTEPSIEIHIYVDSQGKYKITLPKGTVRSNFNDIKPDFYEFLRKIQPELPTASFTLKPDDDDYNFELVIITKSGKKVFTRLPAVDVQLFIKLLLHPQTKLQVQKNPDGTLLIVVVKVKQEPGLVFKNVKSKFIELANDVRTKPGHSVSVQRNGDLSLIIGQGKQGLDISKIDPILVEVFVAIFVDPNYHYKSKLESDGTYTLITPSYHRNPSFHKVPADLFAKARELTTAKSAIILITQDQKENFVVGVSVNGGQAVSFNDLDIELIRLLVISTTYKGLKLEAQQSADGYIIIQVVLPRPKEVYNFNLFHFVVKSVSDINDFFGGLFGGLLKAIGGFFTSVAEGAVSIVSGVGHAAGSIVSSVGKGLGSLVKGIFG